MKIITFRSDFVSPKEREEERSEKNYLVTLLLCVFLGTFGVHRFYAGKIGTGVLMLLIFGGFWIWNFIDFVVIIAGSFKDGDGNKLKN